MDLLERDIYLDTLSDHYQQVEKGRGHAIFLTGEAGIGKTSLVNHFVNSLKSTTSIYSGACDSLFTPRPLGPLFDIAKQVGQDLVETLKNEKNRSVIFDVLVQSLSIPDRAVVLIFEDIHWADEATFDLIKFLARRINRFRCLFLLTYRDDEMQSKHSLASILGEVPPDNFSKIPIHGFSRETIDMLATAKGYRSGQALFALTGGNPFYSMEVLASGGNRIPDRIKDSILTAFRAKSDATIAFLEFLSVMPSRIEFNLAKRIESDFPNEMDACIASGVILLRPECLSFKHELYRLTIEESLPPSKRRKLHRKMIGIILETPGDTQNLSQLIHHAKHADDKELVARIAPQAAKAAAALGAHREALKLYATAIEYVDQKDPILAELYEQHAYECYFGYEPIVGISSQERALALWRERKINVKEGDALRFLSRLWWLAGNQSNAMAFAIQSIEVLENGPATRERALAYNNFSQLFMLSDQRDKALHWGNKAIDLATIVKDNEVLSHALTNVGNMLLKIPASENEGEELLYQSLTIAMKNKFPECVARVYSNLSSTFIFAHRYEKAIPIFDLGLKHCEYNDLGPWLYYMQSHKVRLLFETGNWGEAESLANSLRASLHHPGIVNIDAIASLAKINMRRGQFEEARALILEAKAIVRLTQEAQRIVPILTAELELAWIGEGVIPLEEVKEAEDTLFSEKNNSWHYTELAYWMRKCALKESENGVIEYAGPFKLERAGNWKAAAEQWENVGCRYQQALALFEGDEKHQKKALIILQELGATAIYEMLKSKLKLIGVKNIPRGLQESTRKNPANLTNRQLDILFLLKEGLQSPQIADKLFISPKTVDNHIAAILSKFGVNSRVKAVLEAQKLGAIKK